ncbi:hypothetical protein BHM03_00040365 [Ensete ventricosum]|nr:hypothetical protein BHM03_00040365 [Ensete ventricosum]
MPRCSGEARPKRLAQGPGNALHLPRSSTSHRARMTRFIEVLPWCSPEPRHWAPQLPPSSRDRSTTFSIAIAIVRSFLHRNCCRSKVPPSPPPSPSPPSTTGDSSSLPYRTLL